MDTFTCRVSIGVCKEGRLPFSRSLVSDEGSGSEP
uniref:Uncharacterized protein n=1 Tax=Anguilla anguilla TaxID=7936 RepID=A0A0E9WW12_ANGAN